MKLEATRGGLSTVSVVGSSFPSAPVIARVRSVLSVPSGPASATELIGPPVGVLRAANTKSAHAE